MLKLKRVINNKNYLVTVSHCPRFSSLSTEEVDKIEQKIIKVSEGRNEWGTLSIKDRAVTIKVKEMK